MPMHKKTTFDKVKEVLLSIWGWLTNFFKEKATHLGAGIVIFIILVLGFRFGLSCGGKDWKCNVGYEPPDTKEVKELIR